jgi:hypothetical protein
MEVEMANPDEQAAMHVVASGKPNKATLNGPNGAFRHLMDEHGDVFALVKRLGMSSDEQVRRELVPRVRVKFLLRELGEMAEVYAALKEIVQTLEPAAANDAEPSELADAMAALDALNPGSPEWGPAFLQVSELVEAHLNEEQNDVFFPSGDEHYQVLAAC